MLQPEPTAPRAPEAKQEAGRSLLFDLLAGGGAAQRFLALRPRQPGASFAPVEAGDLRAGWLLDLLSIPFEGSTAVALDHVRKMETLGVPDAAVMLRAIPEDPALRRAAPRRVRSFYSAPVQEGEWLHYVEVERTYASSDCPATSLLKSWLVEDAAGVGFVQEHVYV